MCWHAGRLPGDDVGPALDFGPVDRPRLVLASASPARRALLAAAGIDAAVMVSGVDESVVEAARAETLSLTLARMKASAVVDRLRASNAPGPAGGPTTASS